MQETWVQSLDWKIPWRRKWQATPVFLPEESHGQRSLAGYSPWDHKESEMTDQLHIGWVLVVACRVFNCGMQTLSYSMWNLVPWPGIKPRPPALGAWGHSYWATRKVLR